MFAGQKFWLGLQFTNMYYIQSFCFLHRVFSRKKLLISISSNLSFMDCAFGVIFVEVVLLHPFHSDVLICSRLGIKRRFFYMWLSDPASFIKNCFSTALQCHKLSVAHTWVCFWTLFSSTVIPQGLTYQTSLQILMFNSVSAVDLDQLRDQEY